LTRFQMLLSDGQIVKHSKYALDNLDWWIRPIWILRYPHL
jgi:hypothetical protein